MEFQCKYFPSSDGYYNCDVVNIAKNSSSSSAIAITGNHLQGKTNADVQRFRLYSQHLEVFPRNLHENFPNLRSLWINGCGLKKISKTDLIGLENLEELNLDGNNLTSLPNDLFTGMKKLAQIYFNNNKLERLE